jgi:ABC-2 type transport system ATP-binding protein
MRATCRENLQMHGRLQGMSPRDITTRIHEVMDAVNLLPQIDSVVVSLSAGMKARLRLARALQPSPRALILDEPTGAVDPIAAHGLLSLIMGLVEKEQLAVLISSHRLEEIEALQSMALLLDKGQVRYAGDLNTLRKQWDVPQVELDFADEATAARVVAELAARDFEVTRMDATVRLALAQGARLGDVLVALSPLTSSILHIRETPMPLRDMIAKVYATGAHRPEGGQP